MGKDVIIACDFANKEQTMQFLKLLGPVKPFLKIGMELFYAAGGQFVKELKEYGYNVFLDLKLHDIPNTVKKTMSVLSGLGADMINVHAAGTTAMMEAALDGLGGKGARPLVVAVTQLTSINQERMREELLIAETMEKTVLHYAENTRRSGLDGVVCSPNEAESIHAVCGKDFLTVAPGIRFASSEADDQARYATPEQAKRLGSDYIVVGRPITHASDPAAMYRRCLEEFIG